MKKKPFYILLIFLFACSSLLFSACDLGNSEYIKVAGLKTEYYIGEQINLNSAKVQHYKSSLSKKYTEIDLTADMISGFSTAEAGSFKMTITYKEMSTSFNYVVKDQTSPPDDPITPDTPTPPVSPDTPDTPDTPTPPVNPDTPDTPDTPNNPGLPSTITEQQATEILTQAINTMKTYAEVKQTTIASMMGLTQESYVIMRKDKLYTYNHEEDISWIVKNGDAWEYYEITTNFRNDQLEYKKYDAQIETDNLIYLFLTKSHIDSSVSMTFIEGIQQDDEYTLTYETIGMITKIVVKNNHIISESITVDYSGTPMTIGNITFEYLNQETNSIPNVPNKDWVDGGVYFLA